MSTSRYFLPAHGDELTITPSDAQWGFSGLQVIALTPGESRAIAMPDAEFLIVPLAGSARVAHGERTIELAGRESVFAAVTDVVYFPVGSTVTITSDQGGRFAIPSAQASHSKAVQYLSAQDVPVELRGAGSSSRQVNNFCVPGVIDADRLISCEVLTPGGNWSSYPPHKHDENRPGESVLEEIYYFEVANGPDGPGMGFQRVYGTPERPIDVATEVRTGDTVLIPHGWHGPSMAAPGYDLYYLNVMAGPGDERAWLICDDPAHAWVRQTWTDQAIDPRLPLTRAL